MGKPFMIVATPYLHDLTGFFDKTVMVAIEEPDGGHRAFAVNKAEQKPFDLPGVFMNLAGPQNWKQPYGFLATDDWEWEGLQEGGVTIGTERDLVRLTEMTQAGKGPSKQLICFGLADWAPGQLENEMYEHFSWFKIPLESANVFVEDLEELWPRLVRGQGHDPDEYEKSQEPGFIIEQVPAEPC